MRRCKVTQFLHNSQRPTAGTAGRKRPTATTGGVLGAYLIISSLTPRRIGDYDNVHQKGEKEKMRTTDEPKENGIRVRFSVDMKEYLINRAKEEQKTVSQVIRDIIKQDMVK